MGLFRPYERTKRPEGKDSASSSRLTTLTPKDNKKPTKSEAKPSTNRDGEAQQKVVRRTREKQGATPTRQEAEAARMERLHPNRTPKEQRKLDREAKWKAREQAWTRIEEAPERRLARDYVDVRWTLNEFMLPAMLIMMAAVMGTAAWPSVSQYIALGLWVMMIGTLTNFYFLWRGYKREMLSREPNFDFRRKGLRMYVFNRSLMIRRFRRPGPVVKRGEELP